MISYTPTFHCVNPACDNRQIEPGHVVIQKTEREWMRTVFVHCTACNQIHEDTQHKSGDFWHGSGLPVLVRSELKRAGLLRQIDSQIGTLQSLAS